MDSERSWQVLSRGPSGDRIARSCRHTGPDLTIKTRGERQDRQTAVLLSQYVLGFWGPFKPWLYAWNQARTATGSQNNSWDTIASCRKDPVSCRETGANEDSEDRDSEGRGSEAGDSERGQIQGPLNSDTPYPDVLFSLLFWTSLLFFQGIPCFFQCLSLFSKDFRGLARIKLGTPRPVFTPMCV